MQCNVCLIPETFLLLIICFWTIYIKFKTRKLIYIFCLDFAKTEIKKDCQWSRYSSWSKCSTSCGPGEQIRQRTVSLIFRHSSMILVHFLLSLSYFNLVYQQKAQLILYNPMFLIFYKIIRNLNYAHLTPIFTLHNSHLVFSACSNKYKRILCTEKPVLNSSFQDFWCANIK